MASSLKSIGFVLTKDYCEYDEVNSFCSKKKIDYAPAFDCHNKIFRIYLFCLKDALAVTTFVTRRNMNTIYVNFL